jgi:hypothetical protein
MRAELEKVRTMPEQMKKASVEALCTQWCSVVAEARTLLLNYSIIPA